MKILIVANGNINDVNYYSQFIQESNTIIAADGGADNCLKLNITPEYIIGDLDSISDKAKAEFSEKSKIIQDMDQNKTDMQLAIELADKLDAKHVSIIGAIGSRMDHTIANIMCLDKLNCKMHILDEFNDIYMVRKEINLKGKIGDIISVIALSDVKGLNYEGLKWNVSQKNIESGWIGICNEMISSTAKITLSSGKIIVFRSKEK